MKEKIPFSISHPEAFKRWHPTLNEGLDPDDYSFGSNLKVWWYWEECGHSHARLIKHQTRNSKCYDCSLKESNVRAGKTKLTDKLKSVGSFRDNYPHLALDWSSKNDESANEVYSNSSKKIIWECHRCGHEWETQVRYRAWGKSNCGVCSGRILRVGLNDLSTVNPELASEWSSSNVKGPDEVRYKEDFTATWICKHCSHEWETTVNGRSKGTGCPECYRSSKVSIGQKELAFFIEGLGYEIVMNAIGLTGTKAEVDIYIPELNVAIEYNGDYWHSDPVTLQRWGKTAKEMNETKLTLCHNMGIELLYVWESDWVSNSFEVKEKLSSFLSGKESAVPSLFTRTQSNITLEDRKLIKKGTGKLRDRALTEGEKKIITERYLSGESGAKLSKELGVSKLYTFKFIHEGGLEAAREELGISKNGSPCVAPSRYDEFTRDWTGMMQIDLLKKYGISYKVAHKTARKLGLNRE